MSELKLDIKQKVFLRNVKAILITFFGCKDDLMLDEKAWLNYYDGTAMSCKKAVEEDFEIDRIEWFSWQKVMETIKRLNLTI